MILMKLRKLFVQIPLDCWKDAFVEKSVILVCWINLDTKSTETWFCWKCAISDVCSIFYIKLFGVYYGFPYPCQFKELNHWKSMLDKLRIYVLNVALITCLIYSLVYSYRKWKNKTIGDCCILMFNCCIKWIHVCLYLIQQLNTVKNV